MIVLDVRSELLHIDGEIIPLTNAETMFLKYLANNEKLSYEDIKRTCYFDAGTARVIAYRIRKKTGFRIKNISSYGYKLLDEIFIM